jgi:hypothetical protein
MNARTKPFAAAVVAALTTVAILAPADVARADLELCCIRTVEWLVDNSTFIAVVRDPADGEKRPTALQTLKGDADRVSWPLKRPEHIGNFVYEPPGKGPFRLIYVREGVLLQAVQLGRVQSDIPDVRDVLYGVTQYGRLLLTESQLRDAIDARLRSGPGQAVERRGNDWHARQGRVAAPLEFPLECGPETFQLIVPFTTDRRDYFIVQLRTGTAAERIYAVSELLRFPREAGVRQAIQDAASCQDVAPTFRRHWKADGPRMWTTEDVRKRAAEAMKKMKR